MDKYEVKAGSDNSVGCVAGWLIDKCEMKGSNDDSSCVISWPTDGCKERQQ